MYRSSKAAKQRLTTTKKMERLIFPIFQADCILGCVVVHVLLRVLKHPSENQNQ